ncbi:MAG: hypothetical protein ACR2QQ_09745 [Gammaproteobacteria bacterium]
MKSDRLQDLLVRRATQVLADNEQRELNALLKNEPTADDRAFDFAAAALHLSVLSVDEPLPASLRSAVENDAAAYFAGKRKNTDDV